MSLLTISLILFFTMDPVGNISNFLKVLEKYDPKQKLFITLREMGFALIALFAFSLFGEFIFQYLELSETSLMLSSGVLLFLIALTIIFPWMDMSFHIPKMEPFIIPLAIPFISGPATLATVMLFAHLQPSFWIMNGAILIAWFAALIVLLLGPLLKKLLGDNGLMACEKLMGMILILLAVQRFMDGISSYYQSVSTF